MKSYGDLAWLFCSNNLSRGNKRSQYWFEFSHNHGFC